MIRRFYVHNFRCLEGFDLPIAGQSSLLLIGKNGSGKSTVGFALEVLQRIARGTNRVRDLVRPRDLARGRTEAPMRFEIEAEINGACHQYSIAFDLPERFRELRVLEERFAVDGRPVYTRNEAQVRLTTGEREAEFGIDWHLAALPIVQEQSIADPLSIFKQWLARLLVLRPIPALITGDSSEETLQPDAKATDLGAWFAGLLAGAPAAYSKMDAFLKQVMPDFKDAKNPLVGKDSRSIEVQFSSGNTSVPIPFGDLSDGEKCFFICALALAAQHAYGPLTCFWDEPDNYLALSEVGHLVAALRQAFQAGSQLVATSHNAEAIRGFSDENTLYLARKSHLEPTRILPVSEMQRNGDLVGALVRDDLEP